jgi:hypothetical protein
MLDETKDHQSFSKEMVNATFQSTKCHLFKECEFAIMQQYAKKECTNYPRIF